MKIVSRAKHAPLSPPRQLALQPICALPDGLHLLADFRVKRINQQLIACQICAKDTDTNLLRKSSANAGKVGFRGQTFYTK
jgi:hypothetical protein